MDKFFVPYIDDSPAAIDINGHRVLIVTSEPDDMIPDLEILGGEEIREVQIFEDQDDESEELANLAATINGGVVLTPPGVRPRAMIENLEEELPWIH